jgi:hypothetical protein
MSENKQGLAMDYGVIPSIFIQRMQRAVLEEGEEKERIQENRARRPGVWGVRRFAYAKLASTTLRMIGSGWSCRMHGQTRYNSQSKSVLERPRGDVAWWWWCGQTSFHVTSIES